MLELKMKKFEYSMKLIIYLEFLMKVEWELYALKLNWKVLF